MLTVSTLDGAAYAANVNGVLAAHAGWAPDEITRICKGPFDADPNLARLLDVVRQATAHVAHVDDDVTEVRTFGWLDDCGINRSVRELRVDDWSTTSCISRKLRLTCPTPRSMSSQSRRRHELRRSLSKETGPRAR